VLHMGVPGFVTWLEATAPEALASIPAGAPPRRADVVAFDMNSLLHTSLRNSRDEDRALMSVFQKLHTTLLQVSPRSHVLLAVDGAAPLAKLATQRKRRGSASQRKPKGVPGLCATPGTRFMARLEQALIYWCCQELSSQRAKHLTFELSGSDVPGEGEVKILEWLLLRNCSDVVLVGGDGDLVLQALTLQGVEAFVLREVATQRAPGVGVCVSTLRDRLAAARGLARPTQLDDLEALACFSLMGNDYLPGLKEGSFERLWRTLCALRRHPSLEGERLLVAERAFNPKMLRAMLLVVGRVYRGVSTLISRDVEAGVKPAEARRRHALVGLAPDELSPVVEAVVVEVFELGAKAAVLTDGVIRVKGPSPSARGDRVLSFDNAAQYLSGVLWTLAMYTDGVPSDFAFVCEAINAPACSTLAKYLQVYTPAVPSSAAAPLPAPLVCASLLPPDALRTFAPPELAAELEDGRSLAFVAEARG